MSDLKKDGQDLSFEKAMMNLEEIVSELEAGNLSLDDALAKFEQGVKLSRICSQKLEQAEKKIEMLMASEEGEFLIKPVDLGEAQNG